LLGPLQQLEKGEGLEGVTRGVAFQIAEDLGVLDRARVAKEVKGFSQEDRGALRKLGVRFGAYHIYLPLLLKPAPRALAALLWALHHGGLDTVKGLEEVPHLAASGRTSFAADPTIHRGFYRAAGFRVCGDRVVRVDILERLADLIRPAIAYRPGVTAGEAPAGAADGEGFVVTVAMTSLTGCSGEAFSSILKSLGYASTQRPGPAITVALLPAAATEPLTPTPAETSETASAAEPVETPSTVDAPAEAAPVETTAEAEAGEEAAVALIEIWAQQPRHAQTGPRRAPPRGERTEGGEQRPPRREHRPRSAAGEAGGEGRAARFDKFRTPGKPPRDDRRGPRPSAGFAAPERRERQPDPDSPFAKLAALKAEMEKKGKS
jgi:ATP-dependent RNA helicase SUPV3L1/SUV3